MCVSLMTVPTEMFPSSNSPLPKSWYVAGYVRHALGKRLLIARVYVSYYTRKRGGACSDRTMRTKGREGRN